MKMDKVILKNEVGLHARPAALLIKEASKFKCDINIIKNHKCFNAKSMMAILAMGACKDDELTISAEGEDEFEAVKSIKNLIANLKE